MADRPMASTSRTGRPRTRSRSSHLPSCISVASKAVKPRTKSAQRTQVKGKGKGTGKSTQKKSSKAATVVSSDSEDLEVDFPLHPPNQPHIYQLSNLKNPTHQHTFQLRDNKNQITH